MSECKKCGYKTNEEMIFCPRCGALVKAEQAPAEQRPTMPTRQRSEKEEKQEKHEKREKEEKTEKHEKAEYRFIGPLVGGLVLIIIGLMSYLHITGIIDARARGILWAVLLIIIGIIIIFGAFYATMMARKRSPRP